MDDEELDGSLARANPQVSEAARSTASLVARELAGGRFRGEIRRHPVVFAAAVGAILALMGAGTLSAYQLGIPPFQTTDPGSVRIHPGVPVDYTNSLGHRIKCQAFMEFENITPAQEQHLEAIAEAPDWSDFGDRALARLAIPHASPAEQNEALFDAVTQDLWKQAHEAIPDLVMMSDSPGPTYHGTAMSCTEPGGVDGTP